MKSIVVLSPHLDDAVFSCWHLLGRRGATVITVFAGTPSKDELTLWNLLCGQPSSIKMTRLRLDENQSVFENLGVPFHNLKYLDRQYRPGKRNIQDIANTILKKTGENVVFFAPLAAGSLWRHPDHITLRKVGQRLAVQGYDVSFYADIPYMQMPFFTDAGYERRMMARAGRITGTPVVAKVEELDEGSYLKKRKAMRQYETQYKMANLVSFGTLGRKANAQREAVFHKKHDTK
jgi:LmbE family N-acetylglucosaminyl deacetylase